MTPQFEQPANSADVGRLRTLLEPDGTATAADLPFAEEVLARLARAGRFRDEETPEHVERMSRTCALIARNFGWDAAACQMLRAASALHDIGKVGVPDEVLRKAGALAPEERALIETHAQVGYDILSGSGDEAVDMAATVALTHHERVDGAGYPQGLRGEEIPLVGRIAAVSDVFDALTHERVHRAALSNPEALQILRDGSGTQFDDEVVRALEMVLPEVEQVAQLYPDGADESREHAASLFPGGVTRVLIVEDHEAVARGLELLLRREGLEIAGTTASVSEAERMLERRAVDVVVLDISLNGEDGLRLVPVAKQRGQRVLLYTGSTDSSTLGAARSAGADGIAAKSGSPAGFVAAVRTVARGECYVDPDLPEDDASDAEDPGEARLTPREREIVALIADGLSGEEVAEALFLSPATVRTHLRNAMERSGAKTRAHLVARAAATGQIAIG